MLSASNLEEAMTAQSYPSAATHQSRIGLSPVRCGVTGAVVLTVTFFLCWAAAAVGLTGGSHAFVTLFTIAPVGSISALAIGLCWSVIIGGVTGILWALTYNALAFLDRR
jgi:hypothetical protein